MILLVGIWFVVEISMTIGTININYVVNTSVLYALKYKTFFNNYYIVEYINV